MNFKQIRDDRQGLHIDEDNKGTGFYGVTPVVQPADIDQADQGAMTTVGANSGTGGAGLSLIGDTATVNQAAALMNDLKALQEDIDALDTLLTEVRTALVDTGIMKGSA